MIHPQDNNSWNIKIKEFKRKENQEITIDKIKYIISRWIINV